MTHNEFLTFMKTRHLAQPHNPIKFEVIGWYGSAKKFGAAETKREMVGKIYDWALHSSVDGGRIYLKHPSTDFNPSFYYTDLKLVKNTSSKLMIPTEPQKLDYNYDEYSKILDK